ncbi:substrate import-associated zinc metallohydrolase lipoprotein [Chitinophaga sp. CF118]|uniref:zinc-binding metallopeptidase n=1 Tax=Chitinophaga sp. CF118 TaxID=1884367 RepID=UPI0008E66398|nr:putative zinc-binding metallopeptidase [Chitinophaga sp. CF118]SFE97039.1 substrate import-associated zinc metallohydrolase lipoprotein [Chitinophaga sp. CF118]
MKIIKTFFFILTVVTLGACSKKDDLSDIGDIPGLGGDTWVPTALDQWLLTSFVDTYNIEVKYKWDQFEFELDKTLVPPDEAMVKPALEAIKKVWIDTYVAEAGDLFFRRYSPKFLILCGSASWNVDNGTVTLGTAEGGRKVVLYSINDFRTKGMPGYKPSDSSVIKQIFHVIEHEFGHILHQTILYPPAFKQISTGHYTANWNNISDAEALSTGFISPYAMSGYDDDFVETVSLMLINGRSTFDEMVNSIPEGTVNGVTKEAATAALRQKEAMVVGYFKSAWNIDFYSLQTKKRKAVEQLLY